MKFGKKNNEAKASKPNGLENATLEDVGVLSFGKKKIALGLTWASVDQDTSIREKLLEAGSVTQKDPSQPSIDFDLHTDEKKTDFIGMGSADLGHLAGMKCLVSMLAEEHTGPRWLGVFKISETDDVWWLGSMRDGKVFEDQVLRSRTDAEEALLSDIDAPDWTAIFAPEDWGFPDTREVDLADLIDWKSGQKLKSVNYMRTNIIRGVLAAVVLGIGVGGYTYLNNMKEEQLQQLLEAQLRAKEAVTVTKKDYPWYQAVDIGSFISDCEDQIKDSVYLIPGWETQPISCTGGRNKGTIATGWTNIGPGKFSWLRSAIPVDEKAPTLNSRADRAEWSKSFTFGGTPSEEIEDAWSQKEIELRLQERFQVLGVPIELRASANNLARATNRVVFNSNEAHLSGTHSPQIFGDILKDVPALVPESLIYNVQTGTWDLAFRIYHPPLLPPPPK
jgi:hypothetical protein